VIRTEPPILRVEGKGQTRAYKNKHIKIMP
jgi:hypothetical protein